MAAMVSGGGPIGNVRIDCELEAQVPLDSMPCFTCVPAPTHLLLRPATSHGDD